MAWFQVQIEEPGHLQVRVQAEDTLSIHTQLFDINGTSNLHNDASGASSHRLVEHRYLNPGTYFVQVRRSAGYGRYDITPTFSTSRQTGDILPGNDRQQPYALAIGEVRSGLLGYFSGGTADGTAWFQVQTVEPGHLRVQVQAEDTLSIHLQLFDINGTSNLHNDASGAASFRLVEHVYLNPGIYYVQIRRSAGYGRYTIRPTFQTARETADILPGNDRHTAYSLGPGESRSGLLGYFSGGTSDGGAWFEVTLRETGPLRVQVRGDETLQIHVQLFDTNGTSNLHNDASGSFSNRLVERDNLDPGTYFVQIRRSGGYGRYTITTLEPRETVTTTVPSAVTQPEPVSPPVTPGPSAIPDTGPSFDSFISITHHHFDITPLGRTSRPALLEFRNHNPQPITIWELRWRGADAEHFLIQQPTQFDRLLQPSQALVIEIVFAPKSSGMKWALLEIHTDAGTWHVPFQGISP